MFAENVDRSPKYGAAPIKMPFAVLGVSGRETQRGSDKFAKSQNAPFPFTDGARVTPEQIIEHVGWSNRRNSYQGFLLTVTCVTIASEAAEVALLSLILPHVKNDFQLTSNQTDRVAMSIFFGQMLGCFVMGALADKAGRKPCGVIANVLVSLGGYLSAIAPSANILMACRFAVGLGVGAAFVPVDMLAEACPDNKRSSKTQIANLSFSVGVVLITVIGIWMLDPFGWRVLAFVTAIPPTIALLMSMYLDESPTWLAEKGKSERARKVLNKIAVENTGHALPTGVKIVASSEVDTDTVTVDTGLGGLIGGTGDTESMEDGKGAILKSSNPTPLIKTAPQVSSPSVAWNLLGTRINFARTLCLWTLAFVQTFNFYGLMLHSPTVFRKTVYYEQALDADASQPLVKVENLSSIQFDYPAILVVNSGDVVGNLVALAALRSKVNPRWVAGLCALISIPLLFTPLSETLKTTRWGLVGMMLLGRIPAAPIGAMSWILNAVAYPTLFRATGHGYANAVARSGAVAASSMYSAPVAVSIPIHAVALLAAVPAALFAPKGSLETQPGVSLRRLFGRRK